MEVDCRMIGKSTDLLQAKADNHGIPYWCDNKIGLTARFSGKLFLGVLLKIAGKVSVTTYLHAADHMLQEKIVNDTLEPEKEGFYCNVFIALFTEEK